MKSVVLPDALEKIGYFAFYKTGLESVVLPASIREVSQGAFAECENLKAAEFGEGLEVLGANERSAKGVLLNGVFEGSALEDVKLPSTLRKIEYRAFTDCRNLKRVALPEALERIESECFSKSGLESVRFPPALRAIAESAFRKCGELKEVAFSNGLESIGLFAF